MQLPALPRYPRRWGRSGSSAGRPGPVREGGEPWDRGRRRSGSGGSAPDQQLQRHLMAVYLVPAHGHRDEFVEGSSPAARAPPAPSGWPPRPQRQPALLHHHGHISRPSPDSPADGRRPPPPDRPPSPCRPFCTTTCQRLFIGHQGEAAPHSLRAHRWRAPGPGRSRCHPSAAGPIIAVDVQVSARRPDDQKGAQQEQTNHGFSVYDHRRCFHRRRPVQAYR